MSGSEASQVASSVLGEVFHVAYAVDDLTRAADSLIALSGGTVTDPVRIEALVMAPALSADPARVSGRLCWVLGDEPPVELWEGGAESPWFCPAGGMRFHHIAYYADDMDAAARGLEEQGLTLDLAPYHDGRASLASLTSATRVACASRSRTSTTSRPWMPGSVASRSRSTGSPSFSRTAPFAGHCGLRRSVAAVSRRRPPACSPSLSGPVARTRRPAESSCRISVRGLQYVLSPSRIGTATVSVRGEPGLPTGAGAAKGTAAAHDPDRTLRT
ncbi:VOC family protein [Streptomyces laculatispora]|uniref:VOC family protein n=1 Tax=Streptomyces laculatispora TaxID=887464 RepID=UPI001A94A281|nr:VOC family protein [Streptomyces laculatispora]MBO0914031.1 VOC family protein [Streptomyces laculatispora]